MSTAVAFFVFLLVMLALATLAIILDWMGKPIRRSFRPRTAGTPAWLMVDTPISSDSPISGPSEYPTNQPSQPAVSPAELPAATPASPPPDSSAGLASPPPDSSATAGSSPSTLFDDHAENPPDLAEPKTAPAPSEPSKPGPWQAGESIFKLTPRGTPPSITAVRRRYWKNLSERNSSVVFGEDNRALMAIGQAPQRFNPRTGAIEELDLPESMLRYCWATKRRPTPTWGDRGLDPFARP